MEPLKYGRMLLILIGFFAVVCCPIVAQETFDEEKIQGQEESNLQYGACYQNYGFSFALKAGTRHNYLDGGIQLNTDNTPGTPLDLGDLGLEYHAASYTLGFQMHIDAFRLEFDYQNIDYEGSKIIGADFTINGNVFQQGTALATNFKTDMFRFLMGYNVFANQHFGVGPALKMDYVRWRYEFLGTVAGQRARTRNHKEVAYVMPGVQVDFSFSNPLVFNFAIYGLSYDLNKVDVSQVLITLNARWYVKDSLYLFCGTGYEYSTIDAHDNEGVTTDLSLHAWFANAGFGLKF